MGLKILYEYPALGIDYEKKEPTQELKILYEYPASVRWPLQGAGRAP